MVWINPLVGRITSVYGPRWGAFHTGTDVAPAVGQVWITAANDGVVIAVRTNSFRGDKRRGALAGRTGNGVVIDHGAGVWTYYGHFSTVSVAVGQTVSAGMILGRVGATGNVTGVHLHFEVLINGSAINPQPYMTARGASLGYGRSFVQPGQVDAPSPQSIPAQMATNSLAFTFSFTTPTIRNTRPVWRF